MASTNSSESSEQNLRQSTGSPTALASDKVTAGLDEQCAQWRSYLESTEPMDRSATEVAISELYQSLGKQSPRILWCESPWQMVAMATVLENQMTSVAIKKWNSHPRTLRLSENDFDKLWKNLWRQIDGQLTPGLRTNFMQPDHESVKTTEEKWANNWLNRFSFIKVPPPKKAFNTTGHAVRSEWIRLAKEMRAGCCVRLERDPVYAQLEREYREKLVSLVNSSPVRQLRAEFIAFSSAGFALNIFENFTGANLTHLGIEALSGHAVEEFEKIYTPDDRRALEFAFNFCTNGMLIGGLEQDHELQSLIPFYDYLCDEFPNLPVGPTNRKKAKIYLDLLKQTQYMLPYDRVAFVSERPLVLKKDAQGRLHSETGPALAFADGFEIYSWHGATIPEKVINSPESLIVEDIEDQRNAEIRRVMIERYGMQRYIETSGAREIHSDETGVLYRKEFPNDEALVMVKVTNSTPEPDGSFKAYFLRVPPNMKTAKEAVAWTFNFEPDGYDIDEQT
jgi:hypothetical protein